MTERFGASLSHPYQPKKTEAVVEAKKEVEPVVEEKKSPAKKKEEAKDEK